MAQASSTKGVAGSAATAATTSGNKRELPARAGRELWERWKSPEGQWVETCAVVTGVPNAAMAALHDRMPVILGESDWPVWLGEREGNVRALLRPCPSEWCAYGRCRGHGSV